MAFQLSADLATSCDNHNDSHLRVNSCFERRCVFLKRLFETAHKLILLTRSHCVQLAVQRFLAFGGDVIPVNIH